MVHLDTPNAPTIGSRNLFLAWSFWIAHPQEMIPSDEVGSPGRAEDEPVQIRLLEVEE